MNLTPAQQQALAAWHRAKTEAAQAQADLAESELAQVAKTKAQLAYAAEQYARQLFFPTAEEGTRTIELPDGWVLKSKCQYSRSVDIAVLQGLQAPLAACRASLDHLIRWSADLNVKAYRELTAQAKAVFDTCLTTTPGTPSLELVAPKVKL